MDKITQKEFCEASRWLWGTSLKKGRELYKLADPEYIRQVVNAYRKNNFLAFWYD